MRDRGLNASSEQRLLDDPVGSRVLYRNQRRAYPFIDHADGIYLYDSEGKRYLDALGGVGVVSVGHAVPEVIDALTAQARRVSFAYGNFFTTEAQVLLAEHVI